MSREASAWHEAGHLAAAHCLRGTVGGASIKPGHWHTGQAEAHIDIQGEQLEAGWWDAVLGEPINHQLRDQVERAAMVILAGYVTEVRAGEHGLYTTRMARCGGWLSCTSRPVSASVTQGLLRRRLRAG